MKLKHADDVHEASLTTEHSASSYGQAVLALEDGQALGPGDVAGWELVAATDEERLELAQAGYGFDPVVFTEGAFRRAMAQARTMTELGDRPDYWRGYQRGVRRRYHGEAFGTDEEHDRWLSLVDSEETSRQEMGRGYRDGLQCPDLENP